MSKDMKDLITKNTGLSLGLIVVIIGFCVPVVVAYSKIKVDIEVLKVTVAQVDKRTESIENLLLKKIETNLSIK